MTDLEIIEKLGGCCAIAKMLNIKSPSISYWKRKGIPELRRIQLQALRPDVFEARNEVPTVQPTTTITSD